MSTSDLHIHMLIYKHITEYTLYNMYMSAWTLSFTQNVYVNLKQKFKNIQPLCNLQIQYNFFQNTNNFCIDMGPQKCSITESTKQGKKTVWIIMLFDFKMYYKSIGTKIAWH